MSSAVRSARMVLCGSQLGRVLVKISSLALSWISMIGDRDLKELVLNVRREIFCEQQGKVQSVVEGTGCGDLPGT